MEVVWLRNPDQVHIERDYAHPERAPDSRLDQTVSYPINIDMNDFTLSANLKKLAVTTPLRRIAKASSVPQSSLQSWANGQLPSGAAGHRNLRKLCAYLNCSIETIMFGDISKPPSAEVAISEMMKGADVFSGKFIVDLKVKRIPEDK